MKTVYIQCDYLLGCAGPSGEVSYYTLYTDLIQDPIVVSDIIIGIIYNCGSQKPVYIWREVTPPPLTSG